MKFNLDEKKKCDQFPRLMISDGGRVVLMTSDGVGTILNGIGYKKGTHLNSWVMSAFRTLPKGTKVTLEQE